jgi:hypothetical protein
MGVSPAPMARSGFSTSARARPDTILVVRSEPARQGIGRTNGPPVLASSSPCAADRRARSARAASVSYAHVAQLVERAIVHRVHGGSNPSVGVGGVRMEDEGGRMKNSFHPSAFKLHPWLALLPSSNRQEFRFSVGERGLESLRECLRSAEF